MIYKHKLPSISVKADKSKHKMKLNHNIGGLSERQKRRIAARKKSKP